MALECVWDAKSILGEGPVWLPEEQSLYWVDILAPAVHKFTPSTGEKLTFPMPEYIGCIVPRTQGGWVAAFQTGFAFLELPSAAIRKFHDPEPNLPGNRFNDGKVDRSGRFWAGTMDTAIKVVSGSLYRVDPDLSVHKLDTNYKVTNGPAFSLDGKIMYEADSALGTVFAIELDERGAIVKKTPFVQIPKDAGVPDGMTVDTEGCLWLAHFGGFRVTRFTPKGEIERVIELPVRNVTSVAFGGPSLTRLYITTASTGLSEAAKKEQPQAGSLFAIDVDATGLAVDRFLG
jgi:xylono-1,5-lactonase